MSEELQNNPEITETGVEIPPETSEAAPEPLETSPPEPTEAEIAEQEKKTRLSERMRELVESRKRAEQGEEYWRRAYFEGRQAPGVPDEPTFPDLPEPDEGKFDSFADYQKAISIWAAKVETRKAELVRQERDKQERVRSVASEYNRWLAQAEAKYSDFREVVHTAHESGLLPITNEMGVAIRSLDNDIDVAYYLGKNPQEADRISRLTPIQQALEIGKLAQRVTPPKQRTTTKAPTPITPVGSREKPAVKPEDMTYAEYKKWREAGGGSE